MTVVPVREPSLLSPLRRSHNVVIRVYDPTGNVIEALEYEGEFKEW
jgi:hypothetical protein